jgi:hypothetical protein
MSIFSSLLSFAIVIGAGYATIKYVVPYLQKEMGGTNIGGQKSGTEGSADEAGAVLENLGDALELPGETETPPVVEEKKKKPPYDPKKGMAGKGGSRKKKRTAKTEYNIFEYDDYEDDYY